MPIRSDDFFLLRSIVVLTGIIVLFAVVFVANAWWRDRGIVRMTSRLCVAACAFCTVLAMALWSYRDPLTGTGVFVFTCALTISFLLFSGARTFLR